MASSPVIELRQVVLVWNATAARAGQDGQLRALADALWRLHGPASPAPLLHSVWANAQPARGNTIFGGDWLLLRRLPDTTDPFTWQVLRMAGFHASAALSGLDMGILTMLKVPCTMRASPGCNSRCEGETTLPHPAHLPVPCTTTPFRE